MSKKIYPQYRSDIKRLYIEENLNIKEIASRLGISFNTVYRTLVRDSIKKSKKLKHVRRVKVYKNYTHEYWQKRNSKSKKTLQKKYGKSVINPSQIPGMQKRTHLPSSIQKAYITKKKNNTFNTSKPEEFIFKRLCTKFDIVERNYKSKEYPFKCDFYIPKLNLYIEYQGSWTHGFDGHRYIGPYKNTEECNEVLQKWKEKAKISKFYRVAVNVWVIRDPLKRKIARDNNLNWIEFFTIKEFENWFKNLP